MLLFNELICKQITTEKFITAKYLQYFSSEIKTFISEAWFKDNTNIDDDLIQEINEKKLENFYTQRKKGENNSFICKLV